jgi:hypothetical protein
MKCYSYLQWITTASLVLATSAIDLVIADAVPPTPPPIVGITRPVGAACPIVPVLNTDEVMQVWSDRPFFLWRNYPRGAMSQIDVQSRVDEMEASSILFRATVAGESFVSYVGTPLERGQVYEWGAYSNTMGAPQIIPFEVMPEDEYEQVAMELEAAEQEWQAAGLSPEEQILERITFFAERQLWSDAMQAAFTVPDPSEALTEYQTLVLSLACSGN